MKFLFKFVLIISLSVVITFVILNLSLFLLYKYVVPEGYISSAYNINQFNEFFTRQTLKTNINYIKTGIDGFDDILLRIYDNYQMFSQNSSLYFSNYNQDSIIIPTVEEPQYRRAGKFFYTPKSTFYDQPYMDSAVSFSIQKGNPLLTKRVNLIYQSINDPRDIMVRTTPETSDFIIPSVESVNARFQSSEPGSITFTHEYNDQFSQKDNKTQLLAARLIFPLEDNKKYRMLAEVEMNALIMSAVLNQFYAYKTTAVAMIYIKDLKERQYSILGSTSTFQLYQNSINISSYLQQGTYNVTTRQEDHHYLLGTEKMKNQNSLTAKYGFADHQYDNIIMMTVLNKSETDLANQSFQNFLQSQFLRVNQFMFIWGFIVIVIMIALGYSISQSLFSSFIYMKQKSKQYLENPKVMQKLYFEMKQAASQSQSRIIIQNMISIIQKIESKKKANVQKKILKKEAKVTEKGTKVKSKVLKKSGVFDEYPLNLLDANFQKRVSFKDQEIFETIRQQIIKKLEIHEAQSRETKLQNNNSSKPQ